MICAILVCIIIMILILVTYNKQNAEELPKRNSKTIIIRILIIGFLYKSLNTDL